MHWISLLKELDAEQLEKLPELLEKFREQVPATLDHLLTKNGVFKSQVGDGGRITIPRPEREALDLGEGETIQVLIHKIEKKE